MISFLLVFVTSLLATKAATSQIECVREMKSLRLEFMTELAAITDKFETQIEEMKGRYDNLEQKLHKYEQHESSRTISEEPSTKFQESEIEKRLLLDNVQTPPPQDGVAFSVGLHYDPANLTKGDAIIFDNVKTNIGNLYDSRTGMFRVLVAGVYVFYLNTMTLDGHWVELDIVKNDQALVFTYANNGHRDNSGNMVVTECNVGDDVWVRVYRSNTPGASLDNFATTFSGFLLFKTH